MNAVSFEYAELIYQPKSENTCESKGNICTTWKRVCLSKTREFTVFLAGNENANCFVC